MRAAPGVWALGDITGKGAFTHMSMYQASIVIDDILGRDGPCAEYHAVPRVTFTDPEVGAVGLTEAQAREQGLRVRVSTTQVPTSARGWIHKAGNDGFIKLVEDADRGVLAGATSAGPWGGEVLGALAVAVHAAVPVQRLREMIYAYPTFHRAIETALDGLPPGDRVPAGHRVTSRGPAGPPARPHPSARRKRSPGSPRPARVPLGVVVRGVVASPVFRSAPSPPSHPRHP